MHGRLIALILHVEHTRHGHLQQGILHHRVAPVVTAVAQEDALVLESRLAGEERVVERVHQIVLLLRRHLERLHRRSAAPSATDGNVARLRYHGLTLHIVLDVGRAVPVAVPVARNVATVTRESVRTRSIYAIHRVPQVGLVRHDRHHGQCGYVVGKDVALRHHARRQVAVAHRHGAHDGGSGQPLGAAPLVRLGRRLRRVCSVEHAHAFGTLQPQVHFVAFEHHASRHGKLRLGTALRSEGSPVVGCPVGRKRTIAPLVARILCAGIRDIGHGYRILHLTQLASDAVSKVDEATVAVEVKLHLQGIGGCTSSVEDDIAIRGYGDVLRDAELAQVACVVRQIKSVQVLRVRLRVVELHPSAIVPSTIHVAGVRRTHLIDHYLGLYRKRRSQHQQQHQQSLCHPSHGIVSLYCVVTVYSCSFFFFSTIASITAIAVMFTISRTEASQSVKWIGLFNPIWMGPITSVLSLIIWMNW